jgi:hypothetical protein
VSEICRNGVVVGLDDSLSAQFTDPPGAQRVVKNMQARLALHAHGRILKTRKQLIIFVQLTFAL